MGLVLIKLCVIFGYYGLQSTNIINFINHQTLFKSFYDYFGAIRYRKTAMIVKTTLGSQRAIAGGRAPVWTNIWLKRRKRMYVKAKAIPIPMFQPIPPLLFFEDSATPMIVRMNAENGSARRVFFSIKANLTFASPRIRWVAIIDRKSVV